MDGPRSEALIAGNKKIYSYSFVAFNKDYPYFAGCLSFAERGYSTGILRYLAGAYWLGYSNKQLALTVRNNVRNEYAFT